MAIVTRSLALEEWLAVAADTWTSLSDHEYTDVVARWRAAFDNILERGDAAQGANALQEFEARLPETVLLFNGVSVARAATSTVRRPHAYRAVPLRFIDRDLANQLDMVLVDQAFSFCCVCTHEWQTLARPIFVLRAA